MLDHSRSFRFLRIVLLTGATAFMLSACASPRASIADTDFSGQPAAGMQANIALLSARYKSNPRDKKTLITYAAALRAAGQPAQAATVLETGMAAFRNDRDVSLAYAKALTASGRFDQALAVTDTIISPQAPDWNALSVRGATLDQMGRNQEARQVYQQALLLAPNEPSLLANMGLSYAMTSDLPSAETYLRRAVATPGASTTVRQNLALVIGLQGRFTEAEKLYAAELPADQVSANMAYIRALLTQQNRWDLIKQQG